MANSTQIRISLKLLVTVTIVICGFTGLANAQPRFAGKFTLPQEVQWGQATLRPGQYFIRMDPAGAVLVSSADGGRTVLMKPPIVADSERGSTHLTITTQGNQRTVRSLNLPEVGKSVIFAPLTKSEREVLVKARQIESVPVVTAKK